MSPWRVQGLRHSLSKSSSHNKAINADAPASSAPVIATLYGRKKERNSMTCPRIFVSSTFYDLKHVREIIRKFILDQGYEPVLSEFSDVFYNPSDTVQNSCLKEVSNCDLFVLIVGKRYGSPFPGDSLSITHKEYLEAQNVGIPIYSFVDIDVLHDYEFYLKNNRSTAFQFRVVQEKEVFDLIDEVQRASKDNSLIPYSSIDDILQHLKKQWAKLLKSF